MPEPRKPYVILPEDRDPATMYVFGGPVDEVCISLRIFGDDLDTDEVTRLLGCEPTVSYRKGELLPGTTRGNRAKTGRWSQEGGLPRTEDINAQVVALLNSLSSDMAVWRRLTENFRVDLFCGLFLEEANRGIELEVETMRMLVDRRLKIGFDIYAP